MKNWSKLLKRKLQENGMSFEEFAERINIARGYLRQIYDGRKANPSESAREMLEKFFELLERGKRK